jgi:biotin carboxyl carrier protein
MKRFKFTIRGNQYETEIIKLEGSVATIEVNGTQYDVELEKEKNTPVPMRPNLTAKNGNSSGASSAGGILKVTAPLPGHIMKVFVKEGDMVRKDDSLLIYEAMKMENLLKAEKVGKIKSVKVKPGDTVLQDDVLFEIQL